MDMMIVPDRANHAILERRSVRRRPISLGAAGRTERTEADGLKSIFQEIGKKFGLLKAGDAIPSRCTRDERERLRN
jgi:hypothetical protein